MKYSNVLVLGRLGYHDETIVMPILHEFNLSTNVNYEHIGGPQNFFNRRYNYDQIKDWFDCVPIPELFRGIDVILFTDFWAPFMPMINYMLYSLEIDRKKIKFVSIYLGSTAIPGDVAEQIPHAEYMEDYLYHCYDKVIVAHEWVAKMLPKHAKAAICRHPVNVLQKARSFKHAPIVYFAQRWNYDKGNDRFIEFAEQAANFGIQCIATGPEDLNGKYINIRFVGWLIKEELLSITEQGGYIWGDARQEVFPYSVINAMFMGLTPMLRLTNIYDGLGIPLKYQFESYDEAIIKILSGLTFSQLDWEKWIEYHAPNTRNLAEEIVDHELHYPEPARIRTVNQRKL